MDFTPAEREDSRWSLREEILLGEVERVILARLHEVVHSAESAAAQYVDQETFDHHHKAAQRQYHSLSKLIYPFGTGSKSQDKKVAETLSELWVQEFGDPNSEDTRQRIQREIDRMNAIQPIDGD